MRSQIEWAKQHRNGRLRARSIIERQDRKSDVGLPQRKHWKTDREDARRRRQIERGSLKEANGLAK